MNKNTLQNLLLASGLLAPMLASGKAGSGGKNIPVDKEEMESIIQLFSRQFPRFRNSYLKGNPYVPEAMYEDDTVDDSCQVMMIPSLSSLSSELERHGMNYDDSEKAAALILSMVAIRTRLKQHIYKFSVYGALELVDRRDENGKVNVRF